MAEWLASLERASGNCGEAATRQGNLGWLKEVVWERQAGSRDGTGAAALISSLGFMCKPADFCWHASPADNSIVSRADTFLNQGRYLHSAFIHRMMDNIKICTLIEELINRYTVKYPRKHASIAKVYTHTVQLTKLAKLMKIHQYGLLMISMLWTSFHSENVYRK